MSKVEDGGAELSTFAVNFSLSCQILAGCRAALAGAGESDDFFSQPLYQEFF